MDENLTDEGYDGDRQHCHAESQQHLDAKQRNLSCREDDINFSGNSADISDRLKHLENLAGSFQEQTSGPERNLHISDDKSNLLHDVQNMSRSPRSPPGESRNAQNLFNTSGSSFFGHDRFFKTEYSPSTTSDRHFSRNRLSSQPYQFTPKYMYSSRKRPFKDISTASISFNSPFDSEGDTQRKKDSPVKSSSDSLSGAENPKQEKEKKSITTKTFAHGMMDVSLLTSNATQLRSVLSNPGNEFYTLLLWLIGISIVLQILSGVLLIISDYHKTQVKEKDLQNLRKRKLLSFMSLALVSLVTSLNVLIAAFSTPSYPQQQVYQQKNDVQVFSSANLHWRDNHTEL